MALGALEGADQRGDALGRAALLELVERAPDRLAEPGPAGGPGELAGDEPGGATADLAERAPGREPGADRHAQQVQHVGELDLHEGAARVRPPSQRELGREEAGGGGG